jgi:hypothetical protein
MAKYNIKRWQSFSGFRIAIAPSPEKRPHTPGISDGCEKKRVARKAFCKVMKTKGRQKSKANQSTRFEAHRRRDEVPPPRVSWEKRLQVADYKGKRLQKREPRGCKSMIAKELVAREDIEEGLSVS